MEFVPRSATAIRSREPMQAATLPCEPSVRDLAGSGRRCALPPTRKALEDIVVRDCAAATSGSATSGRANPALLVFLRHYG